MLPPGPERRSLSLVALVSDPVDGAVRLLGDAVRFGFAVRLFYLEAEKNKHPASIRFTIDVPMEADTRLICSRLSRHGSIASLVDLAGDEREGL